jgi:hypothetical protein
VVVMPVVKKSVAVEETVRVRYKSEVSEVVVVVRLRSVRTTVNRPDTVLPVTAHSAIVLVKFSVVTMTSRLVLVLNRSRVTVVVDVCKSKILSSTQTKNKVESV